MDLSHHQLTDWKWREEYRSQMGSEAYDKYFKSVWLALDQLDVNEYYDIIRYVRPENHDLFIKICCQYIITHRSYEFSNDFTKIIRKF